MYLAAAKLRLQWLVSENTSGRMLDASCLKLLDRLS